jgi:hypothetical protein
MMQGASGVPLSPTQRAIWRLHRQRPELRAAHKLRGALQFQGALDYHRLERALRVMLARHDVLRTVIVDSGPSSVQRVREHLSIDVAVDALDHLDPRQREARLTSIFEEERLRTLDPLGDPLLRVRIVRLALDTHVLLRSAHNLIWDGWSSGVFNRELLALYDADGDRPDVLPPLGAQYADFVAAQDIEPSILGQRLRYWRGQLAGASPAIALSGRQPERATTLGGRIDRVIDAAELADVKRLVSEQRTTLYMALIAAFAALISHHGQVDDLVIVTPIANRADRAYARTIGCCVDGVPIRVSDARRRSFRELLAHVKDSVLDALDHHVPIEILCDALGWTPFADPTAAGRVVFDMLNTPWVAPRVIGAEISALKLDTLHVRADLEVHCWERDRALQVMWFYKRDALDRAFVDALGREYVQVLGDVVRSPSIPLRQLPCFSGTLQLR